MRIPLKQTFCNYSYCFLLVAIVYLIQHSVQLIPSFYHTVAIITVNHKDESLGVLEIMSPQRSDLGDQNYMCQKLEQYIGNRITPFNPVFAMT